ncbi:MAG: flippase-like domain-containing protein [Candidatus Krumholzibacteriota bacterium]|nr:flippase-like domain-containing protein [Candidatus Krumholzibacteriota bacterium]
MRIKKTLLQLLKLLVSLGLIAYLLIRIQPSRLLTYLENIDIAWCCAALGIFLLSSLLGAVQWFALLRAGGVSLTLPKTLQLYFVGLFFNNFLPSNVGGDTVKILDVVRDGNDPHRVFAITLLDRIFGLIGLCVLALVAFVIILPAGKTENLGVYMAIFTGCVLPVMVLVFSRRLSRAVKSVFSRIKIWGLGNRLEQVLGHLGSLRHLRSLMIKVALLTLMIQFLRVATHVLVGRALKIEITSWTLVHFYVFVPLLGLIMILPISINGLGIREGTGILLFTRLGMREEEAMLMEFITYVVMVVVSLTGGFIFLFRQLRGR